LSRLKLLGRRALPALLVALLAAGAATPAGASLTRPEVARLAGDVRPALDPRGLELGRLAASARSDPAPAALPDGACSAPVVGPILDPVLDPDPAPELVPVLVGVLIPLDELALPPALDPTRVIGKTFGDLVVGLCRRDVAAVSGSGSSETRLRGEIEPGAAQPQAISIFSCVLAAGSSHTPYGEAHAETGPELLRARYDNDLSEVRTVGGTVTQTVADETVAAPGGVLLSWSLPLDETTLASGLVVEQLQAGAGWTVVPAEELVIGHRPDDGTSTGDDSTNLRVLLASGWQRGTSYRIRLTQELTDRLHRSYGQGQDPAQDLQWSIPAAPATGPVPAVQYDQRFPAVYESYLAAAATAGGRFPAGQNRLFQGLWTDPVTGMSYARARWYDARNAHWLSEDPLGAVDSTNLYAFVGWQPNMGVDPMGLCVGNLPCPAWAERAIDQAKFNMEVQWETAKGVASDTGRMVVGAADFITLGQTARAREGIKAFFQTDGSLVERGNAASKAGNRAQLAVVTLGFSEAEDKSEHLKKLVGIQAVQDSGRLLGTGLVEGDPELVLAGLGKLAEGSGQMASTALLVYAPAEAGVNRLRAGSAASDTTQLFRAVSESELQDLSARSGAFRNPPGTEVKYFATSPEGAASYARQTFQRGGALYEGPYTIVESEIATSAVTPEMVVLGGVDRGIGTIVVPTEGLPLLKPATPLNYTPIPPTP